MKTIVAEYDPNFISMGLDEVNLYVKKFLIKNDMESDSGRQ